MFGGGKSIRAPLRVSVGSVMVSCYPRARRCGGGVSEAGYAEKLVSWLKRHAWASTVHAFQGRTVDNVIAAMEATHPHLTTQKSFYVEISRARDRAELVTDDAKALRE